MFSAVFSQLSKIISRLLGFALLRFVIGLKTSRQFNQPVRSKTKTNCDLLTRVSRAWRRLHVFASSSDWFIGLPASVVIG